MAEQAKLRSTYFIKLKKILEQVKKHETTPLDIGTATTHLERTEQFMKSCEEAHLGVLSVTVKDEDVVTQEDIFDPIEQTYVEIKALLRVIIATLQPVPAKSTATENTASTSTGSPASGNLNIKLPPIELPTFDGNFADWPSFMDLFTATVDSNPQLAPSQKLQYLKSSLQKEPASLIKSLTIIDLHYSEALTILKDRYDNKREIVTSLISKLIYLKSLNNENASELQKLVDTTSETLRALKCLGSPVEHWDNFLVVLLVSKLDSSTKREWAIRQTGVNMATFEELKKFIVNHIRGLIASGSNNTTHRRPPPTMKTHHSSSGGSCVACGGDHHIYKCNLFMSKTATEKSTLAKQQRLCFNCLSKDHQIKSCRSTATCKMCKRRHHTLLHEERRPQQQFGSQETTAPPQSSSQAVNPPPSQSFHHTEFQVNTLLQTAIVRVRDSRGNIQPVRAFLDSGSEGTLITENCVRRLGLKRQRGRVTVKGVGTASAGPSRGLVNVKLLSTYSSLNIDIMAHILENVTDLLPKKSMQQLNWSHIIDLPLADPEWHEPGEVDILIGMDYYNDCVRDGFRRGPINAPSAQNTMFGWVLSGKVKVKEPPVQTYHTISLEPIEAQNVESIIKRFWEVEEPPAPRILTKEEKIVENHFLQTVSRDHNGRFIVRVPFNEKKKDIGYSRAMAVRRFQGVEKRLLRESSSHRQQYCDFMKEYLQLGHMEKLSAEESKDIAGKTYYLPHHHVINEGSSTTKLRVVFDGSAKTSTGISLNDTFFVGATLQDELFNLILRFRLHPIVLKADITKMFRQFYLNKEDADFHRIVWRESPDLPLEDYRLLTVTYGTAYAPNLSTRCLQQLAEDCKESYPKASKALSTDTYVDDIMTSAESTNERIQIYNQLSDAVATAGLQLRKWSTNCPEILRLIPEEERETKSHEFDNSETLKALGVQWCPSSDMFTFKAVKPADQSLTKRVLLSELSRVFDRIGLLSCVTIRAKLQMQELWRQNLGWDEEVPIDVKEKWEEYQQDMQLIPLLQVPRRITIDKAVKYQLHGFSDSSTVAYGCVIYLRGEAADGTITTNFITSKTRVAPLRQITLPRLELMSACELSELISHVKDKLQIECDIWCWSDSTITLRWIAGSPRRWQTFVANRVARIQEHTEVEWWRHVPGTQNPADLASRGVPVSTLNESSFWFKGPEWLSKLEFPVFKMNQLPADMDLEEKKVHLTVYHSSSEASILERFSSLSRLQRVTALLLRVRSIAKKEPRQKGAITYEEMENALSLWIKKIQQQAFGEDISSLQRTKKLPVKSKLHQLYPFMDLNGILRVGGRLQHANISDNRKHQIILPKDGKLTRLVISHYHNITFHGGFTLTISSIQRKFWIVHGRDGVRHFVRSCVTCRLHRGRCAEQLMGSLPTPRITPSRPFINSGMDYAGPFTLKNPIGRAPKTYKGYMCLFVCMATKAIHLEAVSSLSTPAFVETLRRFTSRRGVPAHLYSDCGTNFIGAEAELERFVRDQQHQQKMETEMNTTGIKFNFNPPHPLIKVAYGKPASSPPMEAILNSRPIQPLSSEPDDLETLTPGHFLIGTALTAIPEGDYRDVKQNRLSMYQQQQQMIQHFWNRWSAEYLNTLQQRKKWNRQRDNLEVGELVLIREDNVVQQWKRGRILEVHPGQDGSVRVVTLRTATGNLKRPIVKLIPLMSP